MGMWLLSQWWHSISCTVFLPTEHANVNGNCLVLLVLFTMWELLRNYRHSYYIINKSNVPPKRTPEKGFTAIRRHKPFFFTFIWQGNGLLQGLVCSDCFSIWYSQAITKLLPWLFPSEVTKMSQIIRWNYICGRTCNGLSIAYLQWYFIETAVNVSAWIINYVPHKTTDSAAM